jgi:uncharacterized BrkB/YihY/UPF0761 family membrane protein
VGPRAGLAGCKKSRPHRDFISSFAVVLFFYFSLRCSSALTVLASFFVFIVQHTQQKYPCPSAGFFFCILSYSVLHPYLFVLNVLHFCLFCPYCTTHNTNIHAPGGIRTRNPNKRSAADPSLKPLGHRE